MDSAGVEVGIANSVEVAIRASVDVALSGVVVEPAISGVVVPKSKRNPLPVVVAKSEIISETVEDPMVSMGVFVA